jgi:hypothetical protein
MRMMERTRAAAGRYSPGAIRAGQIREGPTASRKGSRVRGSIRSLAPVFEPRRGFVGNTGEAHTDQDGCNVLWMKHALRVFRE